MEHSKFCVHYFRRISKVEGMRIGQNDTITWRKIKLDLTLRGSPKIAGTDLIIIPKEKCVAKKKPIPFIATKSLYTFEFELKTYRREAYPKGLSTTLDIRSSPTAHFSLHFLHAARPVFAFSMLNRF